MADFSKTRDAFVGLIKKPPLTDKLLQKPPFRFLHDVVMATSKASGFMEGLFGAQELDCNNIKDKEAKTAFLDKVINAIQYGVEQKIEVKTGKIVAGQEPEKTNLLLQNLAAAAKNSKPDTNAIVVAKLLAGEKFEPGATSGGSAGSNKENRTEERKKTKRDSSKEPKDEKKKSSKDKEKSEKRSSSKDSKEKKSSSKERSKEKKDEGDKKKHREKDKDKEKSKDKDKKKEKSSSKKPKEKPEEKAAPEPEPEPAEKPVENGTAEAPPSPPKEPDRRESVSHSATEKPHEPEAPPPARMAQSARPPTAMGRPGSARPAPPRIKRKELGEIEQTPKIIDSGKETAETANIIVADESEIKEEENFLVEEEPTGIPDLANGQIDEEVGANADDLDAQEHGVLVRKILETKKELESGLKEERPDRLTTVVFDEKEREKTRKETAKLQEFIQKLTRTTHPLARLLDYLQEDIDSMTKEMDQWRAEYRKNVSKLRQMTGAQADGNALKSRLIELDSQIRETQDAISATRAKILSNETQTEKLIQSIGR